MKLKHILKNKKKTQNNMAKLIWHLYATNEISSETANKLLDKYYE